MEVVAASIRGQDASIAAERDGSRAALRGGLWRPSAGLGICLTVVIAHAEAHAGECTLETPACHLENGKRLLEKDPKRAADELLASYKLDERTDTLALCATALERARRYGHALETWQRIIVFRESELDAAKGAVRKASSRKRAAARAAVARAEEQMQEAAEAIMRLWSSVARVRVRIPAGQQLAVAHDGEEVDVSREVLVNAGRDELVFTRKDGSVERVTVEVAAGANATIDAPAARMAKAAPQKPMKQEKTAEPTKRAEAKNPAMLSKPAAEAERAEPAEPAAPPLTAVRLTEEPRSRTMSRVGLGLVAGAVVAAGAAGGLGYLSSHDHDRSRELGCSPDGQCPFGPAADLAERSNDRARLAQISAVAGGAMLATGAVLWLVGRGKTRRAPADVALRVAPSFTATFTATSAATSAALSWRF